MNEHAASWKSGNASDPVRRAAWVWRQMIGTFGPRWSRLRGDVPPDVWIVGLASLSREEIRAGLERLVLDWPDKRGPPDWFAFRELCRPGDPRSPEQRARDARMAPVRPALPAPEKAARLSTGRAYLGLWYVLGLRRLPAGADGDTIDAMVGDADVDALRAAVARCRAATEPR